MNIVSSHPEILILLSALLLSFYYTLIKKFPQHMMILYFWLHALSYIGFSFIYFYKEKALTIDTAALEQLAFDTSYNNFPLYIFSSLCLIGTYIILDKLIKIYPVSTILALSQISLILSTLGYVILGDSVSLISLFGIFIIFTGAIISGLQSFSWNNPIKSFEKYDITLLKLSFIKSVLYAATMLITYICTSHYSTITKHILHVLTKHMHFIPFTAIAPIHFNIGVQFANFILMFLFITYHLKERRKIWIVMQENYSLIFQLSVLHILYAYFYYESFALIENKNLITALSKLYLPMTLLFCHWAYKQKVSKEQIVGMSIITLGSIVSIWG